jgi:6-phosphogluconolactonase
MLAEAFAEEMVNRIIEAARKKTPLTLAVSGGNTPKLLFSVLAEKYYTSVDWNMVRLFWVDERCVAPDDPESNFGMTEKILLEKINISAGNVFRMRGEDDPEMEAQRYSGVLSSHTGNKNGFPVFDIIILGMGDDGHTASIFPGNNKLLSSDNICEVAVHPVSGQKRITITGKVINNSRSVFFLVTGNRKSEIVKEIFRSSAVSEMFPSAHIKSVNGTTTWLLDNEAAKFIG